MLIHSIQLKNFLSYGPETPPLELKNLNIIIGPNGSGKSNLFEAVALLKTTPQELVRPIRMGGSVRDWLWKGSSDLPVASLEVVVDTSAAPVIKKHLRYRFDFTEAGNRFEIVDERIEYSEPYPGAERPFFFYKYENNNPIINVNTPGKKGWKERRLTREKIDPEKSILAQRYDPDAYLELSYLADRFKEIRIYRDWTFGPMASIRQPQALDAPGGNLAEDMSNLARILSSLKKDRAALDKLLEYLRAAYEGIDRFDLDLASGRAEIYIVEGQMNIPATRLSDGTLRLLCLLAVLCDPSPPPLICIDEPELGLHPDMINMMADALRYASERTQLIVTTHSVGLVDAFNNTPEAILVCEKQDHCTTMSRLDSKTLAPWLENYRLGDLWTRGHIGGTRW
ncbi:AAA family ATPase [Desulfovibrio sp. OttesenSCG-928-G11]|nr:AAA family ATPase [Desulfovibrio sp. OttesenSCG-928-G11]